MHSTKCATHLTTPRTGGLSGTFTTWQKFAGIFGLSVQDIGAQQTGLSVEEFRAKLRASAV
jgi:hypothetical protein